MLPRGEKGRLAGKPMSETETVKCVEPAAGVLSAKLPSEAGGDPAPAKEERRVQATVGKEAPDFEAKAFVGEGFKNIKLSDYKGQWIMLCFYPGDFTFV